MRPSAHGVWLAAAALLAAGCARAEADELPPVDGQAVVAAGAAGDLQEPPAPAAEPMRSWLGKVRGDVETEHRTAPVTLMGGWVGYGPNFRVRYDMQVVTGIAVRAPDGLGCVEAARWMGFTSASSPDETAEACEWRRGGVHGLGYGHEGRMDKRTHIIEVRLGG